MRSSTSTLVKALRILGKDIASQDGVANAAILEAASRLEWFRFEIDNYCKELVNDAKTYSIDSQDYENTIKAIAGELKAKFKEQK